MWFEMRDGKIVDETFVARNNLNGHHDNHGHSWKGTSAAGQYFAQVMYPRVSDYDKSFYMFEWIDSNNDMLPDVGEVLEPA